jgi:hypothetical protein
VLTAAILIVTAFAAGVTGAWSPCGFSMVETLGSAAPRLGARVVRLSSGTFAFGALAGGALTFTALGVLGRLLHARGAGIALAAAVAIALLAALGEALGVRVVPQIRRQVPEPWRRVMPLPLAAGLYGVLLGLGFTTFVLTLAVWALAGISVAIGSPLAGLLIGLGFGAGRALPVVLMAPRYATLGERLEVRMAEQPQLLRRLRLADAALLTTLAVVLLASGSALAATRVAPGGTDPSVAGGALVWKTAHGAVLLNGDARVPVAAQDVAIGGPYLAARNGGQIVVTNVATNAVRIVNVRPGVTQLAVSRRWLVFRASLRRGGDRLFALSLTRPNATPQLVASGGPRAAIGRPALAGDRLAYAVATGTGSSVVLRDLAARTRRVVLRSTLTAISQPALQRDRLLFVQATYCTQALRVMRLHGRGQPRTLLRIGSTAHRDAGSDPGYSTVGSQSSYCPRGTPPRTDRMLWTTALGARFAYVTLLSPSGATSLVRVRG